MDSQMILPSRPFAAVSQTTSPSAHLHVHLHAHPAVTTASIAGHPTLSQPSQAARSAPQGNASRNLPTLSCRVAAYPASLAQLEHVQYERAGVIISHIAKGRVLAQVFNYFWPHAQIFPVSWPPQPGSQPVQPLQRSSLTSRSAGAAGFAACLGVWPAHTKIFSPASFVAPPF